MAGILLWLLIASCSYLIFLLVKMCDRRNDKWIDSFVDVQLINTGFCAHWLVVIQSSQYL